MKVLLTLITLIIVAAMIVGGLYLIVDGIETIEVRSAKNLGKHIVIKGDTLMIIDHSILLENYTLDNGTTISASLVDKLEVIE